MGPGDVLCDRYQILASIGRGGMGEVFRAVHLPTGGAVAIKVVGRSFVSDVLMVRLQREATAAARIQSEFIPRVLEIDATEEGELFLVMELLYGESLSERMKREQLLPWEEVRIIGDQVLQALIAAHEAGVIHRDLKPGNIFIETTPLELGSSAAAFARARVLDFGVCKLDTTLEAEKLTVTGESVGTVAYMAPEQIRGASRVDQRADLYSFAMVVFELLSGRLAYDATGQMALLASKLEKSARPFRGAARVAVPQGLDALIDRALARRPDDRFSSAREMLDAWRSLGPPIAVDHPLPIVTPMGLSHTHHPTQTALTAGTSVAAPARAAWSSLAVAVAVIIASVAVGIGALRRHPAPSAPAAAAADSAVVAPAEQVAEQPGSALAVAPAAAPTVAPSDTGATAPSVGAPESASAPVLELDPRSAAQPHHRSHPRATSAGARRSTSTGGPKLMEQPHY